MKRTWMELGLAIREGRELDQAIRDRCTLLTAIDEFLERRVRIDHERLERVVGNLMAAHQAFSDGVLFLHLVPVDDAGARSRTGQGIDPCLIQITAGATPRCAALRVEPTDENSPGSVQISLDRFSPDAPGDWARCVWEMWSDAQE